MGEKNINPLKLFFKMHSDYPLPVKQNVDFIRELESTRKVDSFIAKNHPDILKDFADILGGKYVVTKDDELYYVPQKTRLKLTMAESSSAVRSLLDLSFYLNHIAKPGDFLMIDEPETHLHPNNQRRIARLLARLVNVGIKVFISTHSDYIVRELNNLIMLNHDQSHLKEIIEDEGYKKDELLSADKLRVYIAQEVSIKLDENKNKTKCQTLVRIPIDPEQGLKSTSFDDTIDKMNCILDKIVWGGDE